MNELFMTLPPPRKELRGCQNIGIIFIYFISITLITNYGVDCQ